MKNLLTLISILFFFSCDVTEPDTTPPTVTVTYPLNESILTEITTIKVNASDNEKVETVTFFIDGDIVYPHWLGDENFHSAHRSNLLRKDKEFYSQYLWTESDNMEYYWPVTN